MFRIIKTFFTSVVLIAIGVGLSFYGNDYTGSEEDGAYTIYGYNVGGIDYKVSSGIKSTSLPAIGDTVSIKYNPSNPTEVVFLNGSNYVVMFIGAGFVLAGVFGLFRCVALGFKSSKKEV